MKQNGRITNLATAVWKDPEGSVVLVVENSVAPTDAEWNHYCQTVMGALELKNATGIAITDGGGPNTAQRGQINDVLAGRQAPSAVVSESMVIRGIVTALSWFNKRTAAFSPKNINDALKFAGVRGERARGVWELVLKLNSQITPESRTVREASRHVRF